METEENAQDPTAREPAETAPACSEQDRDEPRFAVDEEATLLMLSGGYSLPCRIVEISLSGCRMRTRDRYATGTPVQVEAAFRLRGIDFRLSAETEWTDGKRLVGIRFLNVAPRRMDQLVDVLCELAADNAARAVRRAAERRAAEEKAQNEAAENQSAHPPSLPAAEPILTPVQKLPAVTKLPELTPRKPAAPGQASIPATTTPAALNALAGPLGTAQPRLAAQSNRTAPAQPKPSGRERRDQSRHEVDTSATILLVNVSSRLPGRILNLSLTGCRIRTEERFPVGIYTRVETEFHLEGLPFRLGGVVQAIQDRQHVGIRFLDMSERKREQLAQLIEEIEEMRREQGSDALGRGTP